VRNWLYSHLTPVQANGHAHTKELPLLKQVPPFRQGFEEHGATTIQE
jgi:hypothetical protein